MQRSRGIRVGVAWGVFCLLFAVAAPASAQSMTGASGDPMKFVVLLAGLALLPFFLIMVTSFVKVAVVLSLLRTAIGTQQVPPNQVVTGLAIVLSLYIMAPVGFDAYRAIGPHLDAFEGQESEMGISEVRALTEEAVEPLRTFLLRHADPGERQLLYRLALELREPAQRAEVADDDLLIIIPAFVVTELKEAFIIGFLLFVPFIVIDLVVANILLSLGMHMLSPTTISLPFKLLLFVLVDGWFLVVKGLVLGYTV